MSGRRIMECRSLKDSGRRGPWSVTGDVLTERNLLETTEIDFLSSLFEMLANAYC